MMRNLTLSGTFLIALSIGCLQFSQATYADPALQPVAARGHASASDADTSPALSLASIVLLMSGFGMVLVSWRADRKEEPKA